MLIYYVDIRERVGGYFELHHEACLDLPEVESLVYLGKFKSGAPALSFARTFFENLRACKVCCPECNLLTLGPDYTLPDPGRLEATPQNH